MLVTFIALFFYVLAMFSLLSPSSSLFFFFFNDTATTEIYTLSLHDALPILRGASEHHVTGLRAAVAACGVARSYAGAALPESLPSGSHRLVVVGDHGATGSRSEEHTSELQSRLHLVCRLLLEKKKIICK